MTFEVICALASVVALSALYFMLDKRVQRLERLASQAERAKQGESPHDQ